MRKIEKEEVRIQELSFKLDFCQRFLNFLFHSFFLQEQVAYDDPDKKIYHLCIVNLVLG